MNGDSELLKHLNAHRFAVRVAFDADDFGFFDSDGVDGEDDFGVSLRHDFHLSTLYIRKEFQLGDIWNLFSRIFLVPNDRFNDAPMLSNLLAVAIDCFWAQI